MKANKSAAARTVHMPGVDLREQRDRNAPTLERGPFIVKATRITGLCPMVTHYAEDGRTLCGLDVTPENIEGPHNQHVCQTCRVNASTSGAWLR